MTVPIDQSAFISIKSATKTFTRNGVTAFENLSLDVGYNEIVTIVGPSGCGKTTLLRCIDGLIELTEGTITVGGESVTKPDRRIAVVFQHFGLFPWLTVKSNVSFGLENIGVPKVEAAERAQGFIRAVQLEGFEDSHPHQLSGGMRQRVGLARALATEPEVLLMDEPFGSIDALTREVLQQQLLDLWTESPKTMVFITHSIEEAIILGDRVIVLGSRPGHIKAEIKVPVAHPRDLDQLRQDPLLGQLRNQIWDLLKQESAVVS